MQHCRQDMTLRKVKKIKISIHYIQGNNQGSLPCTIYEYITFMDTDYRALKPCNKGAKFVINPNTTYR